MAVPLFEPDLKYSNTLLTAGHAGQVISLWVNSLLLKICRLAIVNTHLYRQSSPDKAIYFPHVWWCPWISAIWENVSKSQDNIIGHTVPWDHLYWSYCVRHQLPQLFYVKRLRANFTHWFTYTISAVMGSWTPCRASGLKHPFIHDLGTIPAFPPQPSGRQQAG